MVESEIADGNRRLVFASSPFMAFVWLWRTSAQANLRRYL